MLHRNELSGVLSGLTRVRHFVTDDAHIFVRPDQIAAEIEALMGEIRESYSWFGLTPTLTFGTRPDKALGDLALWERAEALMRAALERSGLEYRVKPKDGAFYAPKIDIQITDALGREWQTATIQVDLVMLPERFDLWYIDEDGRQQRPVAIHRAIYGSLERFIGVLTEHFAGAFPFWCAPVQVDGDPDRRPARRAGRRAGGRPARSRRLRVEVDALRQPDAEQDPARPGAEGPVHGRPGRPRGGGADGGPADPGRQQQRARLGRAGRSPGGRSGGARSADDPAGAPGSPTRAARACRAARRPCPGGGHVLSSAGEPRPVACVLWHAVRRAHE